MSRLFISALALLAVSSFPAAAYEEHCGQGVADVKSMVSSAPVSEQVRSQVQAIIKEASDACLSGKGKAAQQMNAHARSMLVDELTDVDAGSTQVAEAAE